MAHDRVDLDGVHGLRDVRVFRAGRVEVRVGRMPEGDDRYFAQRGTTGFAFWSERRACEIAQGWLDREQAKLAKRLPQPQDSN